MPTEVQPVIVKLLRSLGSRKEVEQYLKQYSEIEAKKFAIIKVGGGDCPCAGDNNFALAGIGLE